MVFWWSLNVIFTLGKTFYYWDVLTQSSKFFQKVLKIGPLTSPSFPTCAANIWGGGKLLLSNLIWFQLPGQSCANLILHRMWKFTLSTNLWERKKTCLTRIHQTEMHKKPIKPRKKLIKTKKSSETKKVTQCKL